MTKVTLQIDGMSCSHCLNAVSRALHDVQGVEVKQVQIGRADLEVAGPEQTVAAEQAVEAAGYHATVVSGA
jgi:copper chaperone